MCIWIVEIIILEMDVVIEFGGEDVKIIFFDGVLE